MARPAQSDVRNRLLVGLPPAEFARLAPDLQPVDLPFKQVLIAPGEPIRHVDFLDRGLASWLALLEGGRAIEVGLFGREGTTGVPVLLGADATGHECFIQMAGAGWRIETGALRRAIDASPALHARLLRYAMAFLAQVSQTAACNGAHVVAERLARWLLMAHDRAEGDCVPLTQEFLAIMLGVRRAGVTVAAGKLQKTGLIGYRGGAILIVDRLGLEAAACECYAAVRGQEDALLG